MRRKSNWPAALTLFLHEKSTQPFDWEENNCAFFVADWIAILTGEDIAAAYRPRCTSALSAARVINEAGGLENIAEREFAERWWREISPTLAQRGDVVTATTEHGPALGVCLGARAIFAGNVTVKMGDCARAWRIC